MRIPQYTPGIQRPNTRVGSRQQPHMGEARRYQLEAQSAGQKARELGTESQIAGIQHGMEDARYRHLISNMNFWSGMISRGLGTAQDIINAKSLQEVTSAEVDADYRLNMYRQVVETYHGQELSPEEREIVGRMGQFPVPPEEWGKSFTEYRQKVYSELSEGMKWPGSKGVFENRYNRIANEVGIKLGIDAKERMIVDAQNSLRSSIEYAKQQGNMDLVEQYVNAGQSVGLFTAVEAGELITDAQQAVAYRKAQRMATGLTKRYGLKQGLDYLNGKQTPEYLTDEGRDELKRRITSDYTTQQKIAKEQQDKAFAEAQEKIFDAVITGEQDHGFYAFIDSMPIPAEGAYGKIWWVEKHLTLQQAEFKADEEEKKYREYVKLFDGLKTETDALIESGKADGAEELLHKIRKSELTEGDEGSLETRINAFVKGEKEEAKINEYFGAKEAIQAGDITSINQIKDNPAYSHLTQTELKDLDKLITNVAESQNPNYKTDTRVQAKLDELILQDKTEEAKAYLKANTGAGPDGKPRIALDDAQKYKEDLEKEEKAAIKQAKSDGVTQIKDIFGEFVKEVEEEGERLEIDKARARMITRFRTMTQDVDSPEAVTKILEGLLEEESLYDLGRQLENLQGGLFGAGRKEEERLELIRGIGEENDLLAKYVSWKGAEPVTTANNGTGFFDGSVWYRWDEEKERWEYCVDIEKDKWLKVK